MTAPARLLSVRLQGFKSFAERTHVAFGPGISAVVGPNGSGKSNLADALRWALGEQGRALRSRKSEDVIWAGSERRSALGMADVQLVIDNADGLLPVEYGVVELGRRLYRSGENDYLLNRQRVRLRDLVDLLDAGHLAENAFLFIGQGMVDQALALRPEERRPLFEEVAGVRRHERRRRRAEEQLAEAESNLARVEDILAELRPQARRLATQAEQQASRRSAGDDLAAAILVAAHARWHAAAARVSATAAAVAGARSELDRAMAVLTEHEEAAAGIATNLGERAAGAAERRSSLEVARIELTTLRLREGRVDADLGNVDRERDRLAVERRSIEADIGSSQTRLAEPATRRDLGLDAELGDAERALAEALEELATGRGEVGADDADLAAVRRLKGARQAELDTARRRLAEAERQAAQEGERAAISGRSRTTAEAALTEARSDIEQARAVVADTATARDRSQAELRAAEAEVQRATETLASVGAALASIKGSLEAAAGEIAATETGTFAVAARASGGRRLDRDIRVDPSFRRAVDAALGSLGSAYVVKRAEIDRLAGQRGVAIVAEALTPAARATEAADRRFADLVHGHGGGILSEAVRRDDSGAVIRLLERTAWLPDLASCLELQAAMPAGWLLVARDGGASVGQLAVAIGLEDGLIGRRAEAQRLTSESTRLAAEVDTDRRAAEASEARRDAATIELGRARDIEATASAALRIAEDRERTLARVADAAVREAAWLEAQALRLAAEAERARAALPPGPVPESGQSREPAERPGPDAAVVAIWEARVHEVRQRRDRIAALVGAADAGRQEADRRRAGAEASLAMAQSRVTGLDTTSATVAEREAGLRRERDELSRLLAGAVAREQGAQASLDVLLAEDAGDRDRLAAAEASAGRARGQVRVGQIRAQGAERDELEARLGLENLREQLLVELAGLGRLAIRHLRAADGEPEPNGNLAVEPEPAEDADAVDGELESALEAASRTWAKAAPPADPPSPARLANLRRRFHELGAGNPFAVDEYATLKARLDGLEAQRLDLQAAIDRTRGLILELDALITSQFRATFQALELAFDARFQQLFGGGFARLSLTDPSDLSTTGVEIVARPPGKKPQALAMLSGGERALTAVALLFAMLEVRPVPFCVLDEVDAALDEANIGRFTDALRELSQNTQCIVITHNRGTIEIADALYGVTVGEDSVSRVISLRLEDATAIAGRSRSTSPLTSTVEPLPA